MKPKGLRLFDRDTDRTRGTHDLELNEILDAGCVVICETFLDADQLDKLASRCKEWAKYLRSQKGKKPVVKKWEDLA